MVVDDDADVREVVRQYLEGLGCRVTLAVDGVDALQSLASPLPPCIIVSDLTMPKLGAVGFMRCVRAGQDHSATPVVTMSAESQRERPPGVEAHFDKPFALAELGAVAARFCRGGPARYRAELDSKSRPRKRPGPRSSRTRAGAQASASKSGRVRVASARDDFRLGKAPPFAFQHRSAATRRGASGVARS